MSRSVGEDDLLAWIEGELSPEDEARVSGLLEGDPELKAWAENARQDRDLLCEWGRVGATLAPKDLVEHAVAMAEREALLDSESDHAHGFGRTGSFRLFTTARLAMAAGLMLAVTAGYFALPALQGPTPAPIQTTPNEIADGAIAMKNAAPEEATTDSIASLDRRQEAERMFADDAAPTPTAAGGEIGSASRLADAGRTDSDAEFRQNATLPKESDSVGATLAEAQSPTPEALADAIDDMNPADPDVRGMVGADEQYAFDSKSEEVLEEESPPWVEGESALLAHLGPMEGWFVLESEPDAAPADFQLMTAIGPEGNEDAARMRVAAPAPMGLDEANELALEGMLLITIAAPSIAEAGLRIRESGDEQGIEILEVGSADDAEQHLLAVVTDNEGVEPLINLISSSNAGVMTLQRADAPAPQILDVDAIAWWALPIDQWVDEQTSGVQIRIVAAEAAVEVEPAPVDDPPVDAPPDASPEEPLSVEPPDEGSDHRAAA